MEQMRVESNSRLRYIHHNKSDTKLMKKTADCVKIHQHHDIPEKLEAIKNDQSSSSKGTEQNQKFSVNNIRPSCSKHTSNIDEKVIKIYERKQYPDLPDIQIINEKRTKEKHGKRSKDLKAKQPRMESKEPSLSKIESKSKNKATSGDVCLQLGKKNSSERLSLLQVSNAQSAVSSDFFSLPHIVRSYSSPDLQQKRCS